MTTALDREVFPLASPDGRVPASSEAPSGPGTRPWALRFARVPDSSGAIRVPAHTYDDGLQVSIAYDGGLLAVMENTHSPTIPDGSTENPPPLDEGPKD